LFKIPKEFPGKNEPLPGNSLGVVVALSAYLKGVLIMTAVPFTQCCSMLAIDAKTLRQWLKHSNLSLQAHPSDARIKCLPIEQVQQLATLHGRSLPPDVACTLPQVSAPAPLVVPAMPRPLQSGSCVTLVQPASHLPSTAPQDADLVNKLSSLEATVITLQQQLAGLALELLQERTLRYELRLQTLEALIQPIERPEALQTRGEELQEEEGSGKERRLHPAERRARSRVIPLIEYGAHGAYVVICPQEGELLLTPDSPEWFDWLASLSSFRFVGQQGRFSAYRKGRLSRGWSAYRTIHQHDYQHYLGTTDHLTIGSLEQMAAKLQSHMPSL
jgi:hypothetical protein